LIGYELLTHNDTRPIRSERKEENKMRILLAVDESSYSQEVCWFSLKWSQGVFR